MKVNGLELGRVVDFIQLLTSRRFYSRWNISDHQPDPKQKYD